jgi:hypothetical protein
MWNKCHLTGPNFVETRDEMRNHEKNNALEKKQKTKLDFCLKFWICLGCALTYGHLFVEYGFIFKNEVQQFQVQFSQYSTIWWISMQNIPSVVYLWP